MFIVINSEDIKEGVVTKVDRSKMYTLVDNDSGNRVVLKGSSLHSRILREHRIGKNSIINVIYNDKGVYYRSILYTDCKYPELHPIRFKSSSCLSNYFVCKVHYDGRVYDSSEAAYQSMKTLDSTVRDKFVELTPDEAKWLGRQIQASSELRKDWWKVQYKLMQEIVTAKFTQNYELMEELSKTRGYYLIEDTTGWHDRIWGKCYCESCKGVGWNYLGSILTDFRVKNLGG